MMQRLDQMGRVFATLRSLRGWSLDEAAQKAQVTVEELTSTERGELNDVVTAALATLYGVNGDDLVSEGLVLPTTTDGATVFLLHGAYQDFSATDLVPLDRALRAARIFGALSPDAAPSISRRMQFAQTPVAGPLAKDAAMQGHALARRVRGELGLGHGPLGDLREILEDRLAVAVLVDAVSSDDLRAASILDADRTAAAVLLANEDEHRARNPAVARVYLAHELCHLLFDRARPGCVQIALDDSPDRRSSSASDGLSLLESRAKGFAAELLLPREGIAALIGSHVGPERSLASAKALAVEVAHHFNTPWEIAVRHLGNVGFIERPLTYELVNSSMPRRDAPATSLPAAGAVPQFLTGLPGAETLWRECNVRASDAPDFVRGAIDSAATAANAAIHDLLTRAYADALAGRTDEATDALVWRLDVWLSGGELGRVDSVLQRLDPSRLPPASLTGVLSLTWHARERLGETRARFVDRVLRALEDTWGFPPERIAKLAQRLA